MEELKKIGYKEEAFNGKEYTGKGYDNGFLTPFIRR